MNTPCPGPGQQSAMSIVSSARRDLRNRFFEALSEVQEEIDFPSSEDFTRAVMSVLEQPGAHVALAIVAGVQFGSELQAELLHQAQRAAATPSSAAADVSPFPDPDGPGASP